MNKFEQYLINDGIHFQTAGRYGRVVDKFIEWLKANNLNAKRISRKKFTDFLEECRKMGNKERTVIAKQTIITHYYNFLGGENNPAKSWLSNRKEYTLPPKAIEKEELERIYQSLEPSSPTGYRNRCMLGLVLFQAFKRSELQELRISDINFEKGEVFVQGQLKTNERILKLEPVQMMHLYDYLNKFRKEFLSFRKDETDKVFLSYGTGSSLNNSLARVLKELRRRFPQIKDFTHIRSSVITNWQEDSGIMEAMYKAGHRYISSTDRYRTDKYEELAKQLESMHPLESMNI